MPAVFLLATCAYIGHHDSSVGRTNSIISDIDEASARQALDDHLVVCRSNMECEELSGFIRLTEDEPVHRIRSHTILVHSNGSKYLPLARVCANCGWKADGGSPVYGEKAKLITFYCSTSECEVALAAFLKQRNEKLRQRHVDAGKCMYFEVVDWIRTGFCERDAAVDDHLCSIHHGEHCDVCGRQATTSHRLYELDPNARRRCDEHADL